MYIAISLFFITVMATLPAFAGADPVAAFEHGFGIVVSGLKDFLFYPVLGFPALVLWLIAGGVYFSLITRLVNVRLLKHALDVTRGKYTRPEDQGEITHFQAMATSISGTVGLGNIAGVSVAVAIGGPGAVVWMMIAGIFGMATKFAEATLGHKFRVIEADGTVKAGAFIYLKEGLAQQHKKSLGYGLSVVFAIFCLGGAFGAGNMFQSNQTVVILTDTFTSLNGYGELIALLLAVFVGVVLLGGITRIASVAEMIVPLMAVIYIGACVVVLVVHAGMLGQAVSTMFTEAFSGNALTGGVLGAIIVGFQRSAFSNEAGIGSASIVHPTAKNNEPVRAGCTALLETFVDTMVICFLTGLVVTVTGEYQDTSKEGIALASASFATVIDWFPIVLSVCVFFFAFSTMITWSYYGGQAWTFLFKGKGIRLYQLLFCVMVFFGGASDKLGMILDFSDLLLLSMAIPNLIGMYLMSGIVRAEVSSYVARMKAGTFHANDDTVAA